MTDNTARLKTVRQFSQAYPAFSEASLRWLIFCAKSRQTSKGHIPGNGLSSALIKVGRRILIDEVRFWEWIDDHRESTEHV